MSIFIIQGVVCAIVIAFGFCVDKRQVDLHRLTDWPLKGMPATNGAIFGSLFIAAMLGVVFAIGHLEQPLVKGQ